MFFQNVTLSDPVCATLYLSLAHSASESLCYLFSLLSLCIFLAFLAVQPVLLLHFPVQFQRQPPLQPLQLHKWQTRRTHPSQMRRSAASPSLPRQHLPRFSAKLPYSRLPFQRPLEVLRTDVWQRIKRGKPIGLPLSAFLRVSAVKMLLSTLLTSHPIHVQPPSQSSYGRWRLLHP